MIPFGFLFVLCVVCCDPLAHDAAPTSRSAQDSFAHGVELLEAGRAQEALAALTAAEQAYGDQASSELIYDRALAALACGEVRIVETCAERLAARGGPDFFGRRDFLLGNAAFLEAERAEAESALADADPVALRLAVQHVKRAKRSWIRAAMTRDDWPAARRNVVRAIAKQNILELKAEAAEEARKAKKEKNKKKQRRGPTETEEREAEMQRASTLTPRQLAALLAKIDANDADKRALRRTQRAQKQTGVERDW